MKIEKEIIKGMFKKIMFERVLTSRPCCDLYSSMEMVYMHLGLAVDCRYAVGELLTRIAKSHDYVKQWNFFLFKSMFEKFQKNEKHFVRMI